MKQYLSAVLRSQLLALLLLFLLLYPQAGIVRNIVRTAFATIFIFFLPGYWLSLFFFSEEEITSFERFATSIALSLGLIVFIAFYLHYFGIAVYPIHIFTLSCGIIAFSWMLLIYKKSIPEKM